MTQSQSKSTKSYVDIFRNVQCREIKRLLGDLEPESGVFGGSKRHTELEQLAEDVGELLEESLVVLGVTFYVGAEALVLDQCHIGGKHHQTLGGDVLELLWAIPLAVAPLFLEKQLVVVIGHDGW